MQTNRHKHHGRGAQSNPANRFDKLIDDEDNFDDVNQDHEAREVETTFIPTLAKTIVNRVDSPDIHLDWSMNPYQGCEHGCAYCYARVTHGFWGYSSGLDFESKVLVKRNAPELLRAKLSSKSWQGEPIMLSGNTDCYQPVERRLQITRAMLGVLWEFRQPVGIITKNSLILRDLDLLGKMAAEGVVQVAISINGLDESVRRFLEPRTASYRRRLETISRLAATGIPVNAMIAPVIPGLNDHEIMPVVKAAAEAGATTVNHIVVRLNGDVRIIFEEWARTHFPDRAAKILARVTDVHGGTTNDSRFGLRMRGEGNYAKIIADQMNLARAKYFKGKSMPKYNLKAFHKRKDPQLGLFDS